MPNFGGNLSHASNLEATATWVRHGELGCGFQVCAAVRGLVYAP